MAMTAYNPTTSAIVQNYITVLMTAPAGVPRFDNDPITRNPLGLLIEQQSTNLLTYSGNMLSTWTRSSGVGDIIDNAAIAPDGTQTAIMETQASGASNFIYYQYVYAPISIPYTVSVYFKQGTKPTCGLYVDDNTFGGNRWLSVYNWSTGLITNALSGLGGGVLPTSTATNIGNGWIRLSMTFTPLLQGLTVMVNRDLQGVGGTTFIWGAQLEALPFVTSYIPTTTAQVTRNEDRASITGTNFSSWYNQSQGSFYSQLDSRAGGISATFWSSIGGNTFASLSIVQTNVPRFNANSTPYNILGQATVAGTTNKMSGSLIYGGNMSLAVNGILSGTITAPTSPWMSSIPYPLMGIPDSLYFWNINAGGGCINGHLLKVSYYPKALTSSQLIGLTS